MATIVILDLMGGVALLLWGLHMVQSGISRAFGSDLRWILSKALRNRLSAFAAGLGLTSLLQSSTATGLMTASFAAEGALPLATGLAIMLGTTLIVQLLSFNMAAIAPVLFVFGLAAFRFGGNARFKNAGRIAIGLGLMLLALHILMVTSAPAEDAPIVRNLLQSITADPVMCIVIAAAVTWAAHSSVATVLLIMSLAYSHFITPAAALALVLGANLGSAINPVIEGTRREDPASYRLPVGNLINRMVGIVLVVPFLPALTAWLQSMQPNAGMMTAQFHIAFNVALALIFIGLLDPLAWLLNKMFPARPASESPYAPRYLDESALETPNLALADAARETLRMGDFVENMLRNVMLALMTGNRTLVASVSRTDNVVDHLNEAIKLYVTKLTRESLDERDGKRAMEIISFAINLEHIGDIIDKNLCELATKKIKRRIEFSPDGATELEAFHKRIVDSLRLGFSVFMSGDAADARKLIAQKAEIRSAELAAAERHFERLREGLSQSIETTSLHLDILRDLKRIHSHICSVAYPVLEAAGETEAAAQVEESDPITLSPAGLNPKSR
ncbi:MAG: Na/Pi cotransporter family protein [Xanthobacteraceae bacterium]|nr:Na/Pi cotransporter family protein [Xanthobacteraceae bacterium]